MIITCDEREKPALVTFTKYGQAGVMAEINCLICGTYYDTNIDESEIMA